MRFPFLAMTDIGKHDVPIIVPAALAVAESIGASGKDLITSIAVGLEISSRLNSGIDRIRASSQTLPAVTGYGTASIAAATTVGKLLNLDREKMSNAIGISGYLCPPSTFRKWLETTPIRMIKYGSSGWGAQVGVTSALLAQNGYTGDTELFDGNYGYWRFTGKKEVQGEEIFADLGNNWLWQKVNFKTYPAGGVLSGIFDQFIELIEINAIKPEDIEKITAYAPPIVSFKLFRENDLQTPDDYCFNTRYLLACAAHRIGRSLWQRDEVRQDPKIHKFMKDVEFIVITDQKASKAVEVIADGQSYEGKTDDKREPDKAIDADIILIDKFKDNTSPHLASKRMQQMINGILDLEKLPTIGPLLEFISL